jgi:three-Cys-motif partner protein
LLVEPPFSEIHLIDLDGTRADQLRDAIGSRNEVFVYQGDANQVLLEQVFPRCRYEEFHRALCLLDPYALSVDWKVIHTAGKMRSVEIFYNFMIMDANMNILWRNPDKVPEDQLTRMDKVWGNRSWRRAAYKTEPGLFGEIEEKADNQAIAEALGCVSRKWLGSNMYLSQCRCEMRRARSFTICSLLRKTRPVPTLSNTSLKSIEKEDSDNGTEILHRMD